MSKDKIYPQGLKMFNKHKKAPSFVKGTLVITPSDFVNWVNENQQYLSDYNGKAQLRLQLLEGEKGLYLTVDTYKKQDAPF